MAQSFKTAMQVKAIARSGEIGKHHDDGCTGLYLWIRDNGWIGWLFRITKDGKPFNRTFGKEADVSLAEARQKAEAVRGDVRKGLSPVKAKALAPVTPVKVMTFADVANLWHEYHQAKWSRLHALGVLQSLQKHAFPKIDKPMMDVSVDDVVAVLQPVWKTQNALALELYRRIRSIIDYAIDLDHYTKANPAPRALRRPELPQGYHHQPVNHESICWKAFPAVFKRIAASDSLVAKALVLDVVLGTPRTSEIMGAKWSEITWPDDVEAECGPMISIPASRMKNRKARNIPLTAAALAVLETIPRTSEFIFSGSRKTESGKGHMYADAMQLYVKHELQMSFHTHGLRSTFKTWVQDNTTLPTDWDASELCLAHETGNKVQRSYARSDMMPERRTLLERWNAFLMS